MVVQGGDEMKQRGGAIGHEGVTNHGGKRKKIHVGSNQHTIRTMHGSGSNKPEERRSRMVYSEEPRATKELWGHRSAALRSVHLRPLTSEAEAEGGAPQAWLPGQPAPKQNQLLRRELAHVTRIRDTLRHSGSPLPVPVSHHLLIPASRGGPPTSQGYETRLPSSGMGLLEEWSKGLGKTPLPATAKSRAITPGGAKVGSGSRTRGATAMSEVGGTRMEGETPLHVIRPDAQFMKSFMERQPKVGLCMLWSVGPKRMEMFEAKIQADLNDPHKKEARKLKELLADMRRKLQRTLVNTHTLAADLWRLYRSSDTDRSGRIEYEEFCVIMAGVGLGADVLGHQGMKMLFQVADKDGGGSIDFSEFLSAVVGNIVSV